MVDVYGRWTYEPDTPEEKKCDCDRIADWVREKGYEPETTIENLVEMIITHFDSPDRYGEYNAETGCGGYGDEFTDGAKQYITFNRKRYYVRNAGRLYSPKFVIIGSIEDAAETFKEAGYKCEIQSDTVLMVYYKDNGNDHTQVAICDESREGYYMIEGRVQHLIEWIKRG